MDGPEETGEGQVLPRMRRDGGEESGAGQRKRSEEGSRGWGWRVSGALLFPAAPRRPSTALNTLGAECRVSAP